MTLLRSNFRTESSARTQEMAFPGFKFQKSCPPDPPSYARPRSMIRSDFKLDPPLITPEQASCCIKVVLRQSEKVKAKREMYDGSD
jgi:hypothetical protein